MRVTHTRQAGDSRTTDGSARLRAGLQTGLAALVALCLLSAAVLAAFGQTGTGPRRFSEDDLRAAERARDAALERLRKLEAQSAALARDLADIDADLMAAGLDATAREQAAYAAEEQLMILADETRSAGQALGSDQADLEDLLMALMTFSARRPPALAASPEDAGGAIRAAILMSEAAPELAQRADELSARIATLNRLAEQTRAERSDLDLALSALEPRRMEIAALAEEKRRARGRLDREAEAARARASRLAADAGTLRELLDGLARQAPPPPSLKPAAPTPAAPAPARSGSAPPSPPAQVRPAAAGGPLAPAVGARLRGFGQTRDGERHEGLTLGTRAGAGVIAPMDARVQFSGPFRSYGLMTILDVGGGVLVVMSGLDALYPEAGQQVKAGEPIGRMAQRSSPAPELYLEVRRNGQPTDPERWLSGRR